MPKVLVDKIEEPDDIINAYKVPKIQWKKWSKDQRRCFNYVFARMIEHPSHYLHPKAEEPSAAHFRTTAFNAAWTAADFMKRLKKGK